ncbi:MAG: glycosyltransferase family 2 protein [Tissierellales bacterium]|nr:glycosyltransferase family 2 protein [Tissierellales bacterium]MBN2828261.1 glycosyltransferase family 2 protein [Tissierellales bacterium]
MLVSIITPTYNATRFLDDTIQSILSQTYTNWELLITDDYSTDGTWDILKEYASKDNRIKIFNLEKNLGAGVARNNSIKHASGRYIAFCDSDDQWTPGKLEKHIQFMEENDLALSYSSYKVIDEEGKEQGGVNAPRKVTYQTMLRNNYIGCLTAMYDTHKLGKVYMPEIRKRQDWALWLSILKKVPYALGIQENLAIYRDRSKSISSNKIDLIKYNWNIYRKVEGFSRIKATFYILQFLFYYFKKKLYS